MKRTRTFGHIVLSKDGAFWKVQGEPHLLMKLRRVFGRAGLGGDVVVIANNDEVCRDLEWFMDRYPLKMSKADRVALAANARKHEDILLRLDEIVGTGYRAPKFSLALPPRDYQAKGAEIALTKGSLLVADDVGLGKTALSLCILTREGTLPAVVVTLSGAMPKQWEDECRKFAPALQTHILKKGTPYPLPQFMGKPPDVVILNYHKLSEWAGTLGAYARTVVFDECQELRRSSSQKYVGAGHLAEKCRYRLGLSATPIYNYGGEIYNVLNILSPDALGTQEEFNREWCDSNGRHSIVKDPAALGAYLRENFLMIRRTRSEVGRELPAVSKIPQRVETDSAALDNVREDVAALARIILSEDKLGRGEGWRAREELDWRLRQATGVAKASYVADFVRLLVEAGERVVVYCWHREVYAVLQSKLEDLAPAMFTGSETPAQKIEAKKRFVDDKATPVILMSLRAAAGLDGLQKVCRTAVFAELDWSPGVHEQAIGRIHRDGQPDPVTAYFLLADEGSDPVVSEILGIKREQVDGLRDLKGTTLEGLQSSGDRVKRLAEQYLKKHGGHHKPPAQYEAAIEAIMEG